MPIFGATPNLSDDEFINFGGVSKLGYETADANANALILALPDGGAIDVPVWIVGDQSILDADLGFFDGVTEPRIAIVDADKDSYVALGFNADDDARIILGGSATLILPAHTLSGDLDVDGNNLSNVSRISGNSDYIQIGSTRATSHSLNSENDLAIKGKLEVDGVAYFDGSIDLGSTEISNAGDIYSAVGDHIKIFGRRNVVSGNAIELYTRNSGGSDQIRTMLTGQVDTAEWRFENCNLVVKPDGSNVRFKVEDTAITWSASAPHSNLKLGNGLDAGGQNLTNLSCLVGNSDYIQIGSSRATSHSLNSENDLAIKGKLEVDGMAYFDDTLDLGSNRIDNIGDVYSADDSHIRLFGRRNVVNGNAIEFYTRNASGDNLLRVYLLGYTDISSLLVSNCNFLVKPDGTNCRFQVYDGNVSIGCSGGALKSITEGAADSGGSGYRVLRVPN